MTNLSPELGRMIFYTIMNPPPFDRSQLKKKAVQAEQRLSRIAAKLRAMRLPRTENLSCSHLDCKTKDIADIMAFENRHPDMGYGLEWYLQKQALPDEQAGLMRTYLVRFKTTGEGEVVGYFSLMAGLVSLNEERNQGAVKKSKSETCKKNTGRIN